MGKKSKNKEETPTPPKPQPKDSVQLKEEIIRHDPFA
jgi:hypothetical protein